MRKRVKINIAYQPFMFNLQRLFLKIVKYQLTITLKMTTNTRRNVLFTNCKKIQS